MALNIKDAETDRLARELAEMAGEPITVAVRAAIEQRLASLRRQRAAATRPDLSQIIVRGRQRPVIDQRDEVEILGYGDDGLPA